LSLLTISTLNYQISNESVIVRLVGELHAEGFHREVRQQPRQEIRHDRRAARRDRYEKRQDHWEVRHYY
jgi:hypothetical protein